MAKNLTLMVALFGCFLFFNPTTFASPSLCQQVAKESGFSGLATQKHCDSVDQDCFEMALGSVPFSFFESVDKCRNLEPGCFPKKVAEGSSEKSAAEACKLR